MSSNDKETERVRFSEEAVEEEKLDESQEVLSEEEKVEESEEVVAEEEQAEESEQVVSEEEKVEEPEQVVYEEEKVEESEEVVSEEENIEGSEEVVFEEEKAEEPEEVVSEDEKVEESEEVISEEEQAEESEEVVSEEEQEEQSEEVVEEPEEVVSEEKEVEEPEEVVSEEKIHQPEQPQYHVDELVYKEKIKEYVEQLEQDNKDYDDEYQKCQNWYKNIAAVIMMFPDTSQKVSEIVDELNENINLQIDTLTEEQKSNIDNRAKGINIIAKMFNNTVEKHLDKLKVNRVEKEQLNELGKEDISSEEVISEKLNENYNLISQMRSKKDSFIKDYFNFISSYILPINDGILSGIQYIDLIKDDKINNLILPAYLKLKEEVEMLLGLLGIKELDIKPCDALDYNKIEVFDIEQTDNKELDETIHEVIRTGYSYKEDLYNTGENYVVRTAQVTVYKYDESSKAVD